MFLQQIVNGVTLGTIYSLLALGFSLIFGVLSFINFAHGEVAMIGAYIAWYLVSRLSLGFLPACLAAILTSVATGVIMERVGYKPIRHSPRLCAVIVSLGFSFIISTGVQLIWGTEPQRMSEFSDVSIFSIGGIIFNSTQIWILILAILMMIALQILLRKTRVGMAMRAVALDRNTAGLMGVNTNSIISFTFAVGSGLGAVSAIMMATYYGALYPTMGGVVGMKGFTAVVLGGPGSIPGAMVGGVAMGVIESLAGAVFNAQARDAVSFIVLIIVLMVKPSGLFGKELVKE
jgi:branched-chain amino acid transport system permease protein